MKFPTLATVVFAAVSTCLSFGHAVADDLQKIKDKGKISIAMSGVFPPFSFVDQTNAVVGFDVDIANELAKRIGVEAEIVTTPFDGIIAGLVTGRYDTVVGSMGITEERKKAIDFVGPYYRSGLALFVKNGTALAGVSELGGKTVGVTLGETSEQWARQQGGFNIRTYRGLPEMLLDLNAGRIDAVIADDVPVLVAIKESNAPVTQIKDDSLPRFDIGIALRKNNPELAAALQAALEASFADGTYAAISTRWIGSDIR